MSVAVADDPTLASLDSLEDPQRFHCVKNVPVFKAHKRFRKYDADGQPLPQSEWELLYEVEDGDLPEIYRACRDLDTKHGVLARITLGHIRQGEPAECQPVLAGFARARGVGNFGPGAEPAILYDFYYFTHRFDEARDYPFRSVEYRPGRKTITGIALLKTDPELDLGTLILSSTDPVYFYERGTEHMAKEKTGETPKKDADRPEEKHEDKHKVEEAEGTAPPGHAGAEHDHEMYARMEPHMHAYMGKHYPHLHRMHAEAAQKYEGGALPPPTGPGAPSATNIAPPQFGPNTGAEENALPMSRDAKEQLALYERQQRDLRAELEKTRAEVSQIKRDKELALYEADIEKLSGQFVFDVAKARSRAAKMTADQFADWKADVIENYEKRPTCAGLIRSGSLPMPEGKKTLTRQGAQKAAQRAQKLMDEKPTLDPAEAYEMATAEILSAEEN